MDHEKDQKLPDSSENLSSFIYVNKNGKAVKSQVLNSPTNNSNNTGRSNQQARDQMVVESEKKNPLICTDFLLQSYNNKVDNVNELNLHSNQKKADANTSLTSTDAQSIGRSVPSHNNYQSFTTLNNSSSSSLVRRDDNGNVLINTSLTIEEPNLDINYDHIKYVNLFGILCCWCFPFTGIFAVIFSRLTKMHYIKREMGKARKYLNRAEWMLMLTFFFGFTLIAIGFAVLESFYLRTADHRSSELVYHARSLPK